MISLFCFGYFGVDFDITRHGALTSSFDIVKLIVEQHVENSLLIGKVDRMLLQVFYDRRITKLSHINRVAFFISTFELPRWQNDGIHCQDFIDSWNDDVINSIIKQSLIQIKYSGSCHLNQSVQQFIY